MSKFLFRKNILSLLINGVLINSELADEETKLQMSLGTVIVKTLIIAYNECGVKVNIHGNFLTFHSLMKKYTEVIGLVDLIEENSSTKSLRFHRLLRDLFNLD